MQRWSGIRLWSVMAVLLTASIAARADVASDKAAAILVFPKLLVDASNAPAGPRGQIDTLIRISNTSTQPISIRCFLVDVTPQCPSVAALRNCQGSPCNTGGCASNWQEIDFFVTITARQPIAWLLSEGASECSSTTPSGTPCLPLTSLRPGANGQSNDGSLIPPAQEDPFIGELKCIEVDLNGVPVDSNDLKGDVEITRVHNGIVDVEGYNAIGIPAVLPYCSGDTTISCTNDSDCGPPTTPSDEGTCVQPNNGDNTLVLGGNVCSGGTNAQDPCSSSADCPGGSCVPAGEYSGCPNVLVLDHFFDGANDPVTGDQVITTDLTLVPCSEDLSTQNPVTIPVQFLIFNEFEQRLSTGLIITCFDERPIWNIASPDPLKSIFSAAVQGTLTGQTRMQGVGQDPTFGHAILGIAEEFREGGGSAAFNLHFSGSRPQSDYLYLPASP
jgi:hypothetical protein